MDHYRSGSKNKKVKLDKFGRPLFSSVMRIENEEPFIETMLDPSIVDTTIHEPSISAYQQVFNCLKLILIKSLF